MTTERTPTLAGYEPKANAPDFFAESAKNPPSIDPRSPTGGEAVDHIGDANNMIGHSAPDDRVKVAVEREAVERVRGLADAIEDHLLGSPGNFEIAVSYLDETERDLRTILADREALKARLEEALGLLREWLNASGWTDELDRRTEAFLTPKELRDE